MTCDIIRRKDKERGGERRIVTFFPYRLNSNDTPAVVRRQQAGHTRQVVLQNVLRMTYRCKRHKIHCLVIVTHFINLILLDGI